MKRFLLSAAAISAIVASAIPASAATTGTFPLQVVANAFANITVTSTGGGIVCNVGSSLTGVVACFNSVSVTGAMRSSATGSASLTVTPPAATVVGSGSSSIPVSALKMTCVDAGSSGLAGTATFANAAASAASGVACATWQGPNAFNPSVTITYGIDASQVPADTYPAQNWTVTAYST